MASKTQILSREMFLPACKAAISPGPLIIHHSSIFCNFFKCLATFCNFLESFATFGNFSQLFTKFPNPPSPFE